ncbi:uncharacterized protein fam83e [Anguilla anguilla]|uniref:uncharacterized protein fam83e n=1 Tax=Anguilla anguilla TaxID=7936 RepID=UPI0015AF3EC4|nr:uncharacterized protein fam83e [Anguilla anguilla]XP_035243196.1 uncharacterized protein fam83e [Anguilla anguilla]XP_035243197.1 uncharacterized protein fam83e [Anguilla anguilla]XP_035243198.1 uncharacterized protein fam83e [Anguilla anguilla]
MSNSQEQSLNEDVAFAPVQETSPEFLHCERERRALECLLTEGPAAFHSKLEQERLGSFLAPEEVAQIRGWAQDYRCGQASPGDEEEAPGGERLPSSYCPERTDTPLPSLQLGWPERHCWPNTGSTLVYTNPPVPGSPAIREVLRRMIQGAQTLVAVVTDKLTDSAVVGDLHCAASRGVPVYVVLNKRSVQDSIISPRLMHQNIRVRVLGGKTFCSRDGKMVVGELKENFVLVDLDAVMVGSYSLTWSDAHLHRQLVTVLHGPVVECFDKEFRILYAASTPITESCWANDTLLRMENVFQSNHAPKPLSLGILSEDEMWPPSTNDPIDWEALGVFKKDKFADNPLNLPGDFVGLSLSPLPQFERWTTLEPEPLVRRMEFQRCVPPPYEEQSRNHLFMTETRYSHGSENLHWNTARPEGIFYKPQSWQKIYEPVSMRQTVRSNIYRTRSHSMEETMSYPYNQQINEENGLAHFHLKKDSDYGVWSGPQVIGQGHSGEKGSRLSKKPLILMLPVPENDGSSDVNDILKGLKTEYNSPENPLSSMIKSKGTSMSEQDLGFQPTETGQQDYTLPAWRSHASGSVKPRVTPAQTLMKTRNDEVKAAPSRLPQIYTSPFRPRTSTDISRDWERPQQDWDRQLQQDQERHLDGGH